MFFGGYIFCIRSLKLWVKLFSVWSMMLFVLDVWVAFRDDARRKKRLMCERLYFFMMFFKGFFWTNLCFFFKRWKEMNSEKML